MSLDNLNKSERNRVAVEMAETPECDFYKEMI